MRDKLKKFAAWAARGWDKVAGPKGNRNLLGVVGGLAAGIVKFPFKLTFWVLKTGKALFLNPKGGVEEVKFQSYRLMRATMAGMGISKGPYGVRVDDRVTFLGYSWMMSIVLSPIGVIFGDVVVAVMCLWAPAVWLILGIRPFIQTWRLVKREQYEAAREAVDLRVMHENLEDLRAAPEKLALLKARIEADAPAAKAALTHMRSGGMAHEARKTKAIVQDVGEAEKAASKTRQENLYLMAKNAYAMKHGGEVVI